MYKKLLTLTILAVTMSAANAGKPTKKPNCYSLAMAYNKVVNSPTGAIKAAALRKRLIACLKH